MQLACESSSVLAPFTGYASIMSGFTLEILSQCQWGATARAPHNWRSIQDAIEPGYGLKTQASYQRPLAKRKPRAVMAVPGSASADTFVMDRTLNMMYGADGSLPRYLFNKPPGDCGDWHATALPNAKGLTAYMGVQSALPAGDHARVPNMANVDNSDLSSTEVPSPMSGTTFVHAPLGMGSTPNTVPGPFYATNTSWQELGDIVTKGPCLPPAKKHRGKKSAKCTITKDTKKENNVKIRELEAELQNKLSLVEELQHQNDALKVKERLLQLSVDKSEHNISRLMDHQLPTSMLALLQSFRGANGQSTAKQTLSRVSSVQQPQDLTIDMFRSAWLALIMEMSDVLTSDTLAATPQMRAEQDAHLQHILQQGREIVTALRMNGSHVMRLARAMNLMTGEEVTTDVSFWVDISDKILLSNEQVNDMLAAWELSISAMNEITAEQNDLKLKLDRAISKHNEGVLLGRLDTNDADGESGDVTVTSVIDKLKANLQRYETQYTSLAQVVKRIMTPRQAALMCVYSSPVLPDAVGLLQGLAVRRGLNTTHNTMASTNATLGGMAPVNVTLQARQ